MYADIRMRAAVFPTRELQRQPRRSLDEKSTTCLRLYRVRVLTLRLPAPSDAAAHHAGAAERTGKAARKRSGKRLKERSQTRTREIPKRR